MLSQNVTSVEENEVLVCEICLNFFSSKAEFEEHLTKTRHGDSTVLLKAVSATKVEDKVIVFFEIPQ